MLKIKLNNNTYYFHNYSYCTILEMLESCGVSLNFQCRQGICGVCRHVLKSGKIYYQVDPFALAQNNEIFICIAVALQDVELSSSY